MSITSTAKRAAWIVIVDDVRAPITDPELGGHPADTPVAIFPPQWGTDRLIPVVDALVQVLYQSFSDRLTYRKMSDVPYAAKVVGYGREIEGGYNPTVVAFKVTDLQIHTDDDSGVESVTYTRVPATKPAWLQKIHDEGGTWP